MLGIIGISPNAFPSFFLVASLVLRRSVESLGHVDGDCEWLMDCTAITSKFTFNKIDEFPLSRNQFICAIVKSLR